MNTTPTTDLGASVNNIMAGFIGQLEAQGASFTPLNKSGKNGSEIPALQLYNASLIKQASKSRGRSERRTKADMTHLEAAIYRVVEELHPCTVRQVFYQLVSKGLIRKTENEYNNTVGRLMTRMRRQGRLPYSWVSDNTRWMRKPDTYKNLQYALLNTARTYRRALWESQDVYVEVWCEKDALAGVIMEETEPYDVPLMVGKGYASDTYIHSTAEAIRELSKPAYLYYFGDRDPSGLDIERVLIKKLREFAPEAEIHFERAAVTPEQIAALHLPSRATKTTDTRSRNFEGESVDLDAMPPHHLRALVRQCIERHVDQGEFAVVRRVEQEERETLNQFLRAWTGGGKGGTDAFMQAAVELGISTEDAVRSREIFDVAGSNPGDYSDLVDTLVAIGPSYKALHEVYKALIGGQP